MNTETITIRLSPQEVARADELRGDGVSHAKGQPPAPSHRALNRKHGREPGTMPYPFSGLTLPWRGRQGRPLGLPRPPPNYPAGWRGRSARRGIVVAMSIGGRSSVLVAMCVVVAGGMAALVSPARAQERFPATVTSVVDRRHGGRPGVGRAGVEGAFDRDRRSREGRVRDRPGHRTHGAVGPRAQRDARERPDAGRHRQLRSFPLLHRP
jgi:hypothetical protein